MVIDTDTVIAKRFPSAVYVDAQAAATRDIREQWL